MNFTSVFHSVVARTFPGRYLYYSGQRDVGRHYVPAEVADFADAVAAMDTDTGM